MKMIPRILLQGTLLATALLALQGCKGGPEERDIAPMAGAHHKTAAEEGIVIGLKEVRILKVTPGEKYRFAEVQEGDKTYWIASTNQDIRAGETYFYNEALIRTEFESKDLQTVFDTLLLVTRLVPDGMQGELKAPLHKPNTDSQDDPAEEVSQDAAKSLDLSELIQNPAPYENQWVEFSGTCVKVNPGIMGRNWVHLKALGEAGGEVVLTTQEEIEVGRVVRMQALVRRNRDFGSGYRYDLLLEEGKRIR